MSITKFIHPLTLQQNDTVGILSTARSIEPEELNNACEILQELGLNVVYGATIGAQDNQFAGSDYLRLNDLQTMLDNPEVKAIICARGGYGTARLLDDIDWSRFIDYPKWILGYSDVTALHNTLSKKGVMSIHGIMPLNINNQESADALRNAVHIMMGKPDFAFKLPEHELNQQYETKGVLTGGNLSMLYSLRGTPYDFHTKNRLLFIEDIDEYLYHIDRMMVNFKLGGVFGSVAGLIAGGMTDMNDNSIPFGQSAEEIIANHVPEDLPLFFGASIGHFARNLPVVCGAQASIIQENQSWKLTYKL